MPFSPSLPMLVPTPAITHSSRSSRGATWSRLLPASNPKSGRAAREAEAEAEMEVEMEAGAGAEALLLLPLLLPLLLLPL
eukprot:CAMPEP_0173189256 /NCGR_PEP_ID=MMETSP1141-20130122/11699_1 /TAXON_ID=483371 /ORGANISM="non described non described, Strain CCMP2298" /LENGTH=79 /DNA_ID=CAMNT_0014113255 /DNA_START=573 /DNA_END=808 /DNA_ORIENTATION=+